MVPPRRRECTPRGMWLGHASGEGARSGAAAAYAGLRACYAVAVTNADKSSQGHW